VPFHTHTVPAPRLTRLTRAASLSGTNHNETVVVRDGANLSGSNHNETVLTRVNIGGTNHNETVVVRRSASSGR
jgi:uncharacterized protein YjbI with pentapeptide repeats